MEDYEKELLDLRNRLESLRKRHDALHSAYSRAMQDREHFKVMAEKRRDMEILLERIRLMAADAMWTFSSDGYEKQSRMEAALMNIEHDTTMVLEKH